MPRLLQLTPYPLKSPRHGGQLRCVALQRSYRASGFDVESIAFFHESHYRGSERAAHDLALDQDASFWKPDLAEFADFHAGQFLAEEPDVRARFFDLMRRADADVLVLEQPWAFLAVRRFLEECGTGARKPKLVYSSQNVEWRLKQGARPEPRQDDAYRAEIAAVAALEREVVAAADLVIACTAEECDELRAMAGPAARPPFVVAHNAIEPFERDEHRIAALKRRHLLGRYAMFVGSAHPPNADGFWSMLAPSLSFLAPDEKIVVAGGASHILRAHPTYARWSGINEPRLAVLGEVDRPDLSALLYGAAAIVLPITSGGGSNLKTAEAIYTGRPVVATRHALRGYGPESRWPTVALAETPERFRHLLRDALSNDPPALPSNYEQLKREVTWTPALAAIPGHLAELL